MFFDILLEASKFNGQAQIGVFIRMLSSVLIRLIGDPAVSVQAAACTLFNVIGGIV